MTCAQQETQRNGIDVPQRKFSSFWVRVVVLLTQAKYLFIPSIPHPTTDPAALYSHLPIFMSPSIIFLCALLEIRKISAARDRTHSQMYRRHPSLKKWLLSARQRLAVHTFQLMCFSVHVDCYCPFFRNILLLIA